MNQQLEEMPFLFKDEWWIGCQEPKPLPGGGEACYFRLPFRLSAVPEEGGGPVYNLSRPLPAVC